MKTLYKFAASAIVSVSLAAPLAHADSDAQKLAVAKEMFRAWHDLDWPRVNALFAEQGVLQSMMEPPVVGRTAIVARLAELTPGISQIELKVSHIGIVDGLVFVERVDHFVYNGHAGSVPVVGVLDISGGKVTQWRDYYDRQQLLDAMGVAHAGAGAQP